VNIGVNISNEFPN